MNARYALDRPEIVFDAMVDTLDTLFGASRLILLRPGRDSLTTAWARQCAMAIMVTRFEMPMGQVGRFFERHHTTVLHAVRLIEDRSTATDEISLFLDFLELRVRARLEATFSRELMDGCLG